MKIIGLEEHFMTPELELAQATNALPPEQVGSFFQLFKSRPVQERLLDLGDDRLRQMDLLGLDVMVLSIPAPGVELLAPAPAVALARQANDRLAAAVRAHPDRYAAWAALPTPDPAAAVAELQRAVQELGCCGALINGCTADNKYLDHPDFRPLLALAAQLGCPFTCTRRCRPPPCGRCTTTASAPR